MKLSKVLKLLLVKYDDLKKFTFLKNEFKVKKLRKYKILFLKVERVAEIKSEYN